MSFDYRWVSWGGNHGPGTWVTFVFGTLVIIVSIVSAIKFSPLAREGFFDHTWVVKYFVEVDILVILSVGFVTVSTSWSTL